MPEFFKGAVSINFTCSKETNKIVLHMKDIDLDNSTLRVSSLSDREFTAMEKFAWTYDPVTQFFVAEVKNSFKVNHNYTFSADYKGYTKYDELGFYRSFYYDSNNSKRFQFDAFLKSCFSNTKMKFISSFKMACGFSAGFH
jgi:hypothetical protein